MNDRLGLSVMTNASIGLNSACPLVEINDLHFAYTSREPILKGINLDLRAGEVLALLGVNGAGKSTLIRLLLGFEKPEQGSIRIEGELLHTYSRRELAKRIAYVPQAHSAPFPYSVREVVMLGRIAHAGLMRPATQSDHEAAEAAMQRMGILHLAERSYTLVSGGERQMVLIARALAQEARILIMDEPASGLDFGNQVRLLQQMRSLAAEGYAILKSTHHPDHVLLGADRAALLIDGSIAATGLPKQVLTPAVMQRLYGVDVDFVTHADGRTAVLARIDTHLAGEAP